MGLVLPLATVNAHRDVLVQREPGQCGAKRQGGKLRAGIRNPLRAFGRAALGEYSQPECSRHGFAMMIFTAIPPRLDRCDRKATLLEYLFAIEIKAIAATK